MEILLTYPESAEELRRKSEALSDKGRELAAEGGFQPVTTEKETPEERAQRNISALWAEAVYAPDGGSTAYDALVAGVANDEGMALAYALLSGGQVVEGTLRDAPRFWIDLGLPGETLYLDPSEGTGAIYTAQELFEAGYRWEGGPGQPEGESAGEP